MDAQTPRQNQFSLRTLLIAAALIPPIIWLLAAVIPSSRAWSSFWWGVRHCPDLVFAIGLWLLWFGPSSLVKVYRFSSGPVPCR